MKPNLPNWMFLGGIGGLAVSNSCKEAFPETLGRVFALHWGCAIVSAFFFSLGLFFSLYGLCSQPTHRKRYLLPFFCNFTFFVGMLTIYFFAYVVMAKIYQLTDMPPMALPRLVESAQNADTEPKRIKSAETAYELYGSKVVYRCDSGEYKRYQPSGDDVTYLVKRKQTEEEIQKSKATLKGAIDQYPYLFGFYLGAFFLTFFFGSLWVAFKKLGIETNLRS